MHHFLSFGVLPHVVGVCLMDMSPAGTGRFIVALAAFALLGLLVWLTMDDTRFRTLTFVLLGFFAARTVLGRLRSR